MLSQSTTVARANLSCRGSTDSRNAVESFRNQLMMAINPHGFNLRLDSWTLSLLDSPESPQCSKFKLPNTLSLFLNKIRDTIVSKKLSLPS